MANQVSVMNLLKAMTHLSNLMHRDGGYHEGSFKAFLEAYKCSYVSDLAKYLKDHNYVAVDPSGTKKLPRTFWNRKPNPTVIMCTEICEEVANVRKARDAKRPKYKSVALSTAYKELQDEMTHHRTRLKELEIVAKYMFERLKTKEIDDSETE